MRARACVFAWCPRSKGFKSRFQLTKVRELAGRGVLQSSTSILIHLTTSGLLHCTMLSDMVDERPRRGC